ncbi:MAG: 5-formyltetrahydrofolate cyclo-ligase [Alphaproteobacteria bacterium]|nr:5-formyltetrahydrofolate cyclo-ligase [Alphaproteobacteria bacterium]
MTAISLDQQKVQARQAAKQRRRKAAEENPRAAQAVVQHLQSYLAQESPKCIAGYLPITRELDPQPIMDHWHRRGTITALPVVIAEATPLIFRLYQPGDTLILEKFSTRAPAPNATKVTPDLVLVPMLAFNAAGYRLGYGGGFYDRTIAEYQNTNPKCRFLGLAYADQQHEDVPVGEFDLPLAAIITERGIISTRERA